MMKSWTATAAFAVVVFCAGDAAAICGDVTGEGNVSTADALAVLRQAVGQPQSLQCDCGTGGVCPLTGNNDGCEGVDDLSACSACCIADDGCAAACAAAAAADCDNAGLNGECAEQINDADCGDVCCPGE
jgi:hypothetical protein